MKTLRFTQAFSVAILFAAMITRIGFAQNCESYYPMRNNATFEITHYNEKDKVTSVVKTTVTEKESSPTRVVATANSTVYDGKGKETTTMSYDVACENGDFKMDMRAFGMPNQQQMQGIENIEIKIESQDMVFPKNLTVGMALPDASLHMTGTMNGMQIMNNTTTVTNRKVTGKEDVTTPAGTFSCIVVEEDSHVEAGMGMKFDSHGKSWYSIGVGMVKSEYYRNGKKEGYSLLTKLAGN